MTRAPLLLSIVLVAACSSVDPAAYTTVKGPAFGDQGADFRPVSAVVERRCGTLDCHGTIARPLRLYGQYGLRRPDDTESVDAGYYPGGLTPTTAAELLDNYQSMAGLEPEIFDLVVAKKDLPEALTLVRKPLLLEKHKGGRVWNRGDPGDVCLIQWLTSVPDAKNDCGLELMHP